LHDLDPYVEEHGLPKETYPAAFARRIAEPCVEKVEEPEGDE
jgi:hypothetical protein